MMRDAACVVGVNLARGELVSVERAGAGWDYSFRNGEELETGRSSFFLDATGRRSAAARKVGANRMRADRLVSLPTVVRSPTATDIDETTLLEATESGWFFTCRIGPRERLVSFYTDSDLLPSSLAGRKTFLKSQLDQSRHLLDLLESHSYTSLEASIVVPAHGSLLNPIVGEGWLATGEARHGAPLGI